MEMRLKYGSYYRSRNTITSQFDIYLAVCVLMMPATFTIALPVITNGIKVVSNVNVKRAPPNNESPNQTD